MSELALDGLVLIRLFGNNPLVRVAIGNHTPVLIEPVVESLYASAPEAGRVALLALQARCRTLVVTPEAHKLAAELRQLVRPVSRPEAELLVAAICILHNVPLLTTNVHYKLYEAAGLQVRVFPG